MRPDGLQRVLCRVAVCGTCTDLLDIDIMAAKLFPSGDPVADRRAGFAETLAHLGDFDGAIEVLTGALDLAPGWHAGWFRLGDYLARAGDRDGAGKAWDRAVLADPADPLGAGLSRDLMRGVPVAEAMPPAFVETLFDQYAPRFETSLVEKLSYRGPELLLDALTGSGFARAGRTLDLGCGTGLMGAVLRDRCDWLEGIDLSAGMLAEAEAKAVYDHLEKADIGHLALRPAACDLIVAADVFIYLGALERVIGWCAGSLAPGGRLAFTVELGDAPICLRESRRFTHSRAYVETLLRDAGFRGVTLNEAVLRQDRGSAVPCLIVTATGPAMRHDRQGDGEDAVVA